MELVSDYLPDTEYDGDSGIDVRRAIITDNVPLGQWVRAMKLSSSPTKITSVKELKRGDHIFHLTEIGLGTYHHAIVVEVLDDKRVKVIHLNPPSGERFSGIGSWLNNEVKIRQDVVDSSRFIENGSLNRVDYYHPERCYGPKQVVERAYSKVGFRRLCQLVEDAFDLMDNNCEHFASWCKTGRAFSLQTGKLQIKGDDD